MANRITELVTKLIAKDDASKVIERVADDLDKLEKRKDVEVGVGVKDETETGLRKIDDRLEGLSHEDKQIVVRAQVASAQKEVDRLARSFRDVDKLDDEEVKIRVEALGNARLELKEIQEQADRLDKEEVDITVDADTRGATSAFSKLRTDLSQTQGAFGKIGVLGKSAFANVGSYATEGAAVAAAAIGTFVAKATTDFQKLALEVGKMRDSLGIPAEAASQLKEVVEDLGIPIEAFSTAVNRMNRSAESTPAAFADIGAEIIRGKDGALDVTATFLGVATALDAIPDAGQRAVAGAKIFGKGWGQIAELIEKGGLSIAEAMEQVGDSKIVGDEQVSDARAMRDAVDEMRDKWEGFSNSVGRDIVPAVTTLIGLLGKLTTATQDVLSVLQGDLPGPSIIDNTVGKLVKYTNPLTGFVNTVKAGAGAWDDWQGNVHGTIAPTLEAVEGIGTLNTQLEDLAAQKDPLSVFADQWKILMDDMADGTIDTQDAANAANLLAGYLGKTTDEVLAIADAEIDKQFEGARDAAQEITDAIMRGAEAAVAARQAQQAQIDEWLATVNEAKVSAGEMMGEFDASKIDVATTALENFLAVRQPGVGWLDTLGKTKEGFKQIWDQIEDNKDAIPNIFRTGKENAREFRDAIGEASSSVNEQLVQALENAGGDFQKVREQADALREQMTRKIELKTGLSMDVPEEREKILGLVNAVVPTKRQVEVGIALSKEDLNKLKADLAIEQLQALVPATALQLKIDMAEGEISPAEAAATAQQILTDNGVNVDLEVNTDKADAKLVAFALEERNAALGITVPDTSLAAANNTIQLGPGGTGWPAIDVPVRPVVVSGGYSYLTGGGAGALAAPGGLTAGTTAVGATATSGGMTPLMLPVAAPSSRAVVINQTFQAAVIGDPFDVQRAVEDANRRTLRLMPRTP